MSKVRGRGATAHTDLLGGERGELTLSCLYRSVGGWGRLTLSCSYRSVGGGSIVKMSKVRGRGATSTSLLGEGAWLNVKG
jgi:hypothetical protein